MRAELFLAILALSTATVAASGQELVATTTNFQITGGVSTMDLEAPYSTRNDLYVVHSDAVIRRWDRYVFVLNRFPLDNVLVLDAADDYAVVRQYTVSGGCNLQDLLVVEPGKAYVSCYEETAVRIVDPLLGTALGAVDLSAFVDADGLPEMSALAQVGALVFVGLQRLDRPGGYVPTNTSLLAVIDSRTDTLVDTGPGPGVEAIALQNANPFWRMWFDPALSRLLVVCSGGFLQLDAGLEVVDPFRLTSEGTLITETALGGDLLDAQLVSATAGYALVGELDFDTCVVRFDPGTGEKTATLACSDGFQLTDLELSSAGRLYVGDRSPSASGIRVFDTATDLELTAAPVSLGLPPFDFVLVEQAVTAADALPATGSRLLAWPNPFNPRVSLRWSAADVEAVPLLVVDVRGRHVTRLQPVGGRYLWTGIQADGSPAPSGVYYVQPDGHTGAATRLVLVR